MKQVTLMIIGLLIIIGAAANSFSETIPFDSDKWMILAKEGKTEEYAGKQCIFLSNGLVILKDSQFIDGIIEYDVALQASNSMDPGFAGAVFRAKNPTNLEMFYMRSHLSGKPDACQYQPIFNGLESWQLYPQFIAQTDFSFDEWMHVKIVVSGSQAEVYIKDQEKPLMVIFDLKNDVKAGMVGICSFATPARFANFSVTSQENPPIKGEITKPEPAKTGTILSWMISNSFPEKNLNGVMNLTKKEKQNLKWTKFDCEPNGLANISRIFGIEEEKNTIFAKVVINSKTNQIKPLQFGFSDRVKIWSNDQIIYTGDDSYHSRDYRFLGLIGLYDGVYLPLKKGKNELYIAISETEGGWGFQAILSDMNGIKIGE